MYLTVRHSRDFSGLSDSKIRSHTSMNPKA